MKCLKILLLAAGLTICAPVDSVAGDVKVIANASVKGRHDLCRRSETRVSGGEELARTVRMWNPYSRRRGGSTKPSCKSTSA